MTIIDPPLVPAAGRAPKKKRRRSKLKAVSVQAPKRQKRSNPHPGYGSGPDDPDARDADDPLTSKSYQYNAPPDDIDVRDADDPQAAHEYVEEMYKHFRSKEKYDSVWNDYMDNQRSINARMRSILVDWLVEVHLKWMLVPEILYLYLTINLIDRYLSLVEIARSKLQLLGVTALFIASKYEEIYMLLKCVI